ncbi:P-loop containing nucleoside triphosphate hydrolase protein [Mycena metata]|uniref:DNA 3'-5' helicase n=1 Tax=Mycena metata TaxID=1033252 RepID=A0AAD7JWQ8_9AGAR|nr:P-loop containing nucleoside triphosphate hydrolase protein [Mycena metata]KAJ7751644.1 P-loop containing nucleoside triphosphate hydrolase protein [Mycena metata]KAJ7773369.1 P-loop containing nucleoside triphosphate hydrolase protein [Mycena metata]
MTRNLRWQSSTGRDTIARIVKKLVPAWTSGLRPVQEELVSAILDSDDVLCCTATGDGKSCAFYIPILVLNEYNTNRADYPAGLPTRPNPVGIVVTPTKGLAANLVRELGRMKIRGFTYCRESLAEARRSGRNLADEIKNCDTWQVVCVDPEHLKTKDWRVISESSVFRAHLLYAAADEVHLINEWGTNFRVDFRGIGPFFRGRLPVTISIVGLSATLTPGKDTMAVCQSLGFFDGRFRMIHRTNERPDIQFSIQTLSHGLSGYEFPDLLPFLRSGRKTIFHFHSLATLFRCYVYIWRLQPNSANKMRRTRMYHSGCPPEYNEETIRLIDEDPELQIILATIAFANGINASSLLDSITVGSSGSPDTTYQEKGRVCRKEGARGRGVLLIQKSSIAQASKVLNSLSSTSAPQVKKKGVGKLTSSELMTREKAELITENHCYNAFWNRLYQNPPIETSTLDCIAVNRPLPCELCRLRANISLQFPAPDTAPNFPSLTPVTASKPPARTPKKLKLTRKERDSAEKRLKKYRDLIGVTEQRLGRFLEHPRIMFLPPSLVTVLLDKLLMIRSQRDLEPLVEAWYHRETHSAALFEVISQIRGGVEAKREAARTKKNAAARRKRTKRKRIDLSDVSDEGGDEGEEDNEHEAEEDEQGGEEEGSDNELPASIPLPPRHSSRLALQSVTNLEKRPRKAPRKAPTVAETTAEYGRQYKPRERRN